MNKMNELAQAIINDETQPQRAVTNYLLEVFEHIKGVKFNTIYERGSDYFDDHLDFFEEVIMQGTEQAVILLESLKTDQPEEYEEIN